MEKGIKKSVSQQVIDEKKQQLNYKEVEPFNIIEKDGEIFIVFGNSIVSNKRFKNFEEAENYINSKPYEIIFATTCAIIRNIK